MDLNPVLSEIQGLSPAAKGALGMAGHTLPAAPDPTMTASPVLHPGMLLPHPDPGAPPGNVTMPDTTPMVGMPSQTPQLVTGPKRGQATMSSGTPVSMGTTLGDTAERSRLLNQGPGVDQIAPRIESSGFGQNHPFLGKLLGGAAEVGGKIGDTLLNAAPGIAREIPGSTAHHNMLLGQANTDLTQDVANAQKEAQAGQQQAQASEAPSAIERNQAEAHNLEHPPSVVIPTSTGDLWGNPRTQETSPVLGPSGQQVSPYQKPGPHQHIVLQGKDGQPMIGFVDPSTGVTTDAQGAPIANPIPFEKVPQEQPKPGISNGKSTFGVFTPGKGWTDAANGIPLPDFQPQPSFAMTGLWQPTEGTDAKGNLVPGRMNERTGDFVPNNSSAAALPKDVTSELSKELQTGREADKRLAIMEQNESAALKGDQQAMLSLVANHIGMTLGAQKGARINQAVWNEAVESAPWLQNVAKTFDSNGYLQGVKLSPQQIKQMVDLGKVVRDQQWNQVHQAFSQYGIQTSPENVDQGAGGHKEQQQATPTQHKVGDKVTLDGKQVTIKKIYPDGTFDY